MKLKKGDIILVAILIVAAVGWLSKDMIWPDTGNKQAVIKVGEEVIAVFPLNSGNELKEIPVKIPDHNYVHIITEQDQIWVEDASCPDKVCVKTGIITKPGQSIVCLPNKTVVYIEGLEKTDVDDISY